MRFLLLALLLAVPAASAGVTEIATPPTLSSPLAVEVAPDGAVWFTSDGGWALGRFEPAANRTTAFPLAAPKAHAQDSLYSIALGADAAWTASQRHLHRVDIHTGEARAFELPQGSDLSGGVLVDDAGQVWATLLTSDKLVRLDPASGQTRVFNVSAGEGPLLLAPAGEGRAYLTQTYGNALARLDTRTGEVSTVARGLAAPTGVAFDGSNAWVGEHGGSSLARVGPDGKVARFPTAASPYYPVSGPNGIAISVDGAVWFAVHFADRVARFDPAARSLVEYEAPSSPGANVQHLAIGPDGKVWFAEWSKARIGFAELGRDALDAQLPASLDVTAGGSASAPLAGEGLRVSTGVENLTGKVEGGRLTVEAKGAAPGSYHVLVYRQTGKTFVGRYVDVAVVPQTDSPLPPWVPIAAALGALAWRRRA